MNPSQILGNINTSYEKDLKICLKRNEQMNINVVVLILWYLGGYASIPYAVRLFGGPLFCLSFFHKNSNRPVPLFCSQQVSCCFKTLQNHAFFNIQCPNAPAEFVYVTRSWNNTDGIIIYFAVD